MLLRFSFPITFVVCLVFFIFTPDLSIHIRLAFGALSLILLSLSLYDIFQKKHSILRNFPLLGRFRYFAESIRPEIRQYFIENDLEGTPFSRQQRDIIYERAKDVEAVLPFGTEMDVYDEHYYHLKHSIAAKENTDVHYRTHVGGQACAQPYSASILNISAMSYGALGSHAVEAMNLGAKKGGFFQCTGEGGVSSYHLKHGGDLVWQIGTGYFGCRKDNGEFSPDKFKEQARHDHIKMIEIKLSQGAKPGHGGVLPAAKVSKEISEIRGVPQGEDCISPPYHKAFSTPLEFCEYIDQLRILSGGKPVGFKLCIGFESEFFSICKAMIQTGIYPDFITVDGGEGGTGAAPQELSNRMGMPLETGLNFVHQTLKGCGLRDKIKIAASGKFFSATSLLRMLVLGADWCNSARAFMMSVGCIQARICHTNQCPVGVTTSDINLQRGLVITDKSDRAYNLHHNTLKAVAELLGACGLSKPKDLSWTFLSAKQESPHPKSSYSLSKESLTSGQARKDIQGLWNKSDAEHFSKIDFDINKPLFNEVPI